MNLTEDQAKAILIKALSYLGVPYKIDFGCVDFVRHVYGSVGIRIPHLSFDVLPAEFNLGMEEIANPPTGRLLFLLHKRFGKSRSWNHVAIILPDDKCIHNSFLLGRVTISTLKEMLEKYEFVPNKPVL